MPLPLSDYPNWPRYMSRQVAAAYVGVSTDLWDDEVRRGLWPQPRRRGYSGKRVTWDRRLLDLAADRDSGLTAQAASAGKTVADNILHPGPDDAEIKRRLEATYGPKRDDDDLRRLRAAFGPRRPPRKPKP